MNADPILFRGRKYRLARREQKSLKTYFGRVLRDVERKLHSIDLHKNYESSLCLLHRLYDQTKDSKNKVYSLHAPEVECISKGKTHKKYEFGCKASYVTSSQGNFVLEVRWQNTVILLMGIHYHWIAHTDRP